MSEVFRSPKLHSVVDKMAEVTISKKETSQFMIVNVEGLIVIINNGEGMYLKMRNIMDLILANVNFDNFLHMLVTMLLSLQVSCTH